FSLTINSCAAVLVLSGSAPSSLRMTSIFLPATVSPCCFMYSLIALSICLPVEACPPVIGTIRPILTVSSARAGANAKAPMAAAPSNDHTTFPLATNIYPSSLNGLSSPRLKDLVLPGPHCFCLWRQVISGSHRVPPPRHCQLRH